MVIWKGEEPDGHLETGEEADGTTSAPPTNGTLIANITNAHVQVHKFNTNH